MGGFFVDRDKWESKICKEVSKLIGQKIECRIVHQGEAMLVFIDKPGSSGYCLARFSMAEMPGCCGLVISFHTWVSGKLRNKKLGSLLHKIKLEMAVESGYAGILCTDVKNNEPQAKILKNNNWIELTSFTNFKTGNEVSIHYKSLPFSN